MNPLQQIADLAGKPVGAVSKVLNRPNTAGRHRPFYGLNVVDMIRGGSLDDAVRKARGRSIYTLEAHIHYLHEIKEGARVRVEMRVLAHDAKRMHLYLEMFAGDGAEAVAAGEQMLLHVDTSGPRSAVFDSDVEARVRALVDAQAALPAPRYAGRVIGLPGQTRK